MVHKLYSMLCSWVDKKRPADLWIQPSQNNPFCMCASQGAFYQLMHTTRLWPKSFMLYGYQKSHRMTFKVNFRISANVRGKQSISQGCSAQHYIQTSLRFELKPLFLSQTLYLLQYILNGLSTWTTHSSCPIIPWEITSLCFNLPWGLASTHSFLIMGNTSWKSHASFS